MASTLLEHCDCTGCISIDAGNSYRLVAPSFVITCAGITKLMMDIIVNPKEEAPQYICCKCFKELSGERLKADVIVKCQICGNKRSVENTVVHSAIGCVCSICISQIKDAFVDPTGATDLILQYIKVFGLTKPFRSVPLFKVLTMPIKI